jgi:hypothetical protein
VLRLINNTFSDSRALKAIKIGIGSYWEFAGDKIHPLVDP